MRHITITLQGRLFEQQFYEIKDDNKPIIQQWRYSQKNKFEIDKDASEMQLVATVKVFDPQYTRMVIKEDETLITAEPYRLSDETFLNYAYGAIDALTYDEPIVINASSRAFASHPEQWLNDAQRVYDYDPGEQCISSLNPLLLHGVENGRLQDKEYLIKTITHFAVYKYEFDIDEEFLVDKLDLFKDPNANYYTFEDNIIPDFVLYDEVFCGGIETFSTIWGWDWSIGYVRNNGNIFAEYIFPLAKGNKLECDTFATVPF